MNRRRATSGTSFATLSALPFLLFVIVFGGYAGIQVIRMAFAHIRVQHGRFIWSAAGLANFRGVLPLVPPMALVPGFYVTLG